MMKRLRLLAAGLLGLAVLVSCTSPFTSRTTITPIYAATSGGLSVFNGTSWTNYTTANGLPSNTVNAVTVYGSGANAYIYAATASGVEVYDGSSWSGMSSGLSGSALDVTSIFLGNSYLYAGTAAGLYVYGSSSWVPVAGGTTAPGNSTTTISDVYANGTAYAAATGSTNQGLYISDLTGPNGFVQLTGSTTPPQPPGSSSGGVTAVFVDQSGNLFAGTSSGLQILPYGMATPTWTTIGAPYLPSSTTINSIWVDPFEDIYVATANGLTISFDAGGSWQTFTAANGLGSDVVNQVFVVGDTIYAATNGGVSVSTDNGKSWKTYTTSDGLGSNQVNGIFVSPPIYSYGS